MSKAFIFNLSGCFFDKHYIGKTKLIIKTLDKFKLSLPHNIINNYCFYDSRTTFQKLLLLEDINKQWINTYNRHPAIKSDSRILNDNFNEYMSDHIDDIDNNNLLNDKNLSLFDTLNKLKNNKIKLTLISPYNYENTNKISNIFKKYIEFDYSSNSDFYDLSSGNQIYDIMMNININVSHDNIYLIDNTYQGIDLGNKLNINTVSILDGSPHKEIFTSDNFERLNKKSISLSERKRLNILEKFRNDKANIILRSANPNYIFDDIDEFINQNTV